ncbi:nitroreductase/quinone reductase family protein [Leekyejoonella antrihumi]|uniref:Nitroreductase family deazaflavin-dependent oxidoreductase n=1 Tax=Leekyejoonella antrihumi TaxID=1660198 RepID=A0A563DW14_9MICO|nr:nitroreductase/quinone reductase family protein [Leekyejoonella antrihumi]TWP34133.1 nitroreductase family deazaflavin-dependent oxidoreductase [Leekyejoonella antrihumi]
MDMSAMNHHVIEQFRGGESMRMPREQMLLLTTRGRRTGREHTTPMMFTTVGGTVVVVASNSGAPRHPDWYRNLVADPRVSVEPGTGGRYEARARVIPPERRAEVWDQVVAQISLYVQHQASTSRQIPLVELIPVGKTVR